MEIVSNSASDTLKIGALIAKNLKKQDIVCLFGQLGTGKTILTKGIALGLGIKPGAIISPSFVLMRQYVKAGLSFYHFDLYRLRSINDILGLGYEEYFYGDGITVIEWADRLKYILPKEFLKINLYIKTKSKRLIKLSAFGRRYSGLLGRIQQGCLEHRLLQIKD